MTVTIEPRSITITSVKEAEARADTLTSRSGFMTLHTQTGEKVYIRFGSWEAADRIADAINAELGVTA